MIPIDFLTPGVAYTLVDSSYSGYRQAYTLLTCIDTQIDAKNYIRSGEIFVCLEFSRLGRKLQWDDSFLSGCRVLTREGVFWLAESTNVSTRVKFLEVA